MSHGATESQLGVGKRRLRLSSGHAGRQRLGEQREHVVHQRLALLLPPTHRHRQVREKNPRNLIWSMSRSMIGAYSCVTSKNGGSTCSVVKTNEKRSSAHQRPVERLRQVQPEVVP